MFFAVVFMSVLLLAAVLVLLVDAVPAALRWYERIGIGCFADEDEWRRAVIRTAERQLKKTPAVPVSANTRLTVIDRLKGSYKSQNLQHWQKAALLLGLSSLGGELKKAADSGTDLKAAVKRQNFKNSVDFVILGYAALSAPTADSQKLRPMMDKIYAYLAGSAKDGTVPYNHNLPDIRFVDTVGMICPFLYKYAAEYSCPDAEALAKKQTDEYFERGMHGEVFLPVHCFDSRGGAPLGIYGWGRGCGWLALGLAESLKWAPHSDKEHLLELSKRYAGALLKFQSRDGSWCRQMTACDIGETSATAMIGYFISSLYNICKDEQYKKHALAARAALISRTRRNGKIDCAQGDTQGIGFYSPRLDSLPAAQGFALLLDSSIREWPC